MIQKVLRYAEKIGLDKEELLRLQQIVIENTRFLKMGFREEGGFVGEHDRITSDPIPEHISAKSEDLEKLINGLILTYDKLEKSNFLILTYLCLK